MKLRIDINSDRSENVKYDYDDFPVYIRRSLLSYYPNFAADSHWHDDIELIAVLSGQMQYNINGTVIDINEGEGVFVNAKQLHFGFSESKTECDFICILFHPIALCSSKMFESRYVAPVLNSEMPYIRLSAEVEWHSRVLRYIRDICDKKDDITAPLHTQGLLYLLWSEVASSSHLTEESNKKYDTRLSTLKSMITYIHEHYSEKITLQEIALAGHISKRTCGSIFMKYLNKTPMEFLMDHRLRKSISLMKSTDMTVLEIALAVGFSGASYFAEAFRRHFGKSPAEYRKSLI